MHTRVAHGHGNGRNLGNHILGTVEARGPPTELTLHIEMPLGHTMVPDTTLLCLSRGEVDRALETFSKSICHHSPELSSFSVHADAKDPQRLESINAYVEEMSCAATSAPVKLGQYVRVWLRHNEGTRQDDHNVYNYDRGSSDGPDFSELARLDLWKSDWDLKRVKMMVVADPHGARLR
jgi:hypothetical protein